MTDAIPMPSAQDAPQQQIPQRLGVSGTDGRDDEQRRTEQHHPFAAPGVGEPTGEPCTDRAPEKRDGHCESVDEEAQLEGVLDGVDGAVDDRTVEPEQEAADRGGDGDADDLGRVLFGDLGVVRF